MTQLAAELGDKQKVISQCKCLMIRGKCQDLVAFCSFLLCIINHQRQKLTLAQGNSSPKGQSTLLFLAMRTGGDTSEHPASGRSETRGPTCRMPVEHILKLVLLSEIQLLKDLFCNRHRSRLLQIALQSSDLYQC